jgi:hypothetical protein
MHPKKSKIFQGTRFIPLSLKRRGGGIKKRGRSPLLDTPKVRELKRGEA